MLRSLAQASHGIAFRRLVAIIFACFVYFVRKKKFVNRHCWTSLASLTRWLFQISLVDHNGHQHLLTQYRREKVPFHLSVTNYLLQFVVVSRNTILTQNLLITENNLGIDWLKTEFMEGNDPCSWQYLSENKSKISGAFFKEVVICLYEQGIPTEKKASKIMLPHYKILHVRMSRYNLL